MKKVLVTGASGFLGTHLVKELYKQGYEIRILVRKHANLNQIKHLPLHIVYGEIEKREDVYAAIENMEIVIHAASITKQTGISYPEYEKVNFKSTKYVVEACKAHHVTRMIHVSTANTFAPGTILQPGTELNGFSLYNANSGYINTKYLAQQYVLEQVARNNFQAIVVNPTFMIGAEDAGPSSGQIVLYQINSRIIFYPSGGKNFVHVKDVCNGILQAIEKAKIGDCYLLAGENLSYKQFFSIRNKISKQKSLMICIPAFILKPAGYIGSILNRIFKKKIPVNYSNMYMICSQNYYSGHKSVRELGIKYTPVTTAIQEAYHWFKEKKYI